MSEAIEHPPAGQFSFGSILSRSFNVLIKNFVLFFFVSLILMLPLAYFGYSLGMQALEDPLNTEAMVANMVPYAIGTVLWMMVAGYLAQSFVTYGTIQNLRGQSMSASQAFARSISILVPAIIMGFVASIGILFGMLLLIVPGIILALMWYVAIPSMVVEKTGIFESLARSAQLTKGYKGNIFGLYIIILIIGSVISLILELLPINSIGIAVIIEVIYQGAFTAFVSVVSAVVYHDLRIAHEGVDTNQIATVFD